MRRKGKRRWWAGDYHLAILAQLMVRNHGDRRCTYCGKWCEDGDLTLDHVVPLSDGGLDTLDNMVLCCLGCNQRKGARRAEDFAGDQHRKK